MTPIEAHGRRAWPRARLMLIVAALGLVADVAMAQEATPCFPAPTVRQNLAERHKEEPITRGVTAQGNLLETWTSRDGSTWTLLATSPDGRACIVATGKNLEVRHHSEEGEES